MIQLCLKCLSRLISLCAECCYYHYTMVKPNVFLVSFTRPQAVYYAGETVEGYVIIELAGSMTFTGISARLEGKSFVYWSHETEASDRGSHSSGETYCNKMDILAGRNTNDPGEDLQLDRGHHTLPFSFELPADRKLPSSFEGMYGHVRYSVKSVITAPDDLHYTQKSFTVICPLDLNTEPSASQAVEKKKTKEFCCLCCSSGPVSAMLVLERKGYVPGENILIKAEVDNKSNREMSSSSVVVTTEVIYRAATARRTVDYTVAELRHGSIPPGETGYWDGDQIAVPPLPPSRLSQCELIDIRYKLEFRVTPSGVGFDLLVPTEIIIGTVPLQHKTDGYPPGELVPATMPLSDSGDNPSVAVALDLPLVEENLRPGPAVPDITILSSGPATISTDIPRYPQPTYKEGKFSRSNPSFRPLYSYYE